MPFNMHLPRQKRKQLYIRDMPIKTMSEIGQFCNSVQYRTDNRSIFLKKSYICIHDYHGYV